MTDSEILNRLLRWLEEGRMLQAELDEGVWSFGAFKTADEDETDQPPIGHGATVREAIKTAARS